MNISLPLLAAALAISLFSSSCLATASDIAELKESSYVRDRQQADALAQLQQGTISPAEYAELQAKAKAEWIASVDAKFDEVQERGHQWLDGMPTTGNTLVDMGIGLLVSTFSAERATSFVRDRKRRVRGEPVGKMATPAPATPPLPKATPPILSAPSIIVAAPSGP